MANQYKNTSWTGNPPRKWSNRSGSDWLRPEGKPVPSVDYNRPNSSLWSNRDYASVDENNGRRSPYYVPPDYMDVVGEKDNGTPPFHKMSGGFTYKNGGRNGAEEPPRDGSHTEGDGSGSPSKGITRLFSKYADKCSLNGVPYIKTSKNPVVKFVWSFLLMAAIGAMFYHLFSLFNTFFKYETHSQIELTFNTLKFPAITICNVNALRMSKVENTSASMQELIDAVDPARLRRLVDEWEPGYDTIDEDEYYEDEDWDDDSSSSRKRKKRQTQSSQSGKKIQLREENFLDDISLGTGNITFARDDIDDFYDENYGDSWEAESQRSSFYIAAERFTELYSAMTPKLRSQIGHQIRDMLIQCSFAGGKCVQKNFTRVLSSTYGNCYTLEYSKFVSRRSGPADGMDLILYLETDEYVPGITTSKGLQLVIHEQGTVPFPDDEGIAVGAGTQTFIGLRQVEVSRLGDPYTECTTADSFSKVYGVKYTRTTCQKICEQELIRSTCKCFDELRQEANAILKIPAGLKPCRNRTELSCVAKVEWEFETNTETCKCNSPCKELKYEKTISTRQWPTIAFAHLLVDTVCKEKNGTGCDELKNKPEWDLPQEFVKLNIFYEDLNYEKLEEKENYELDQFLSDIGGIIGLWIGLSLLSIFELVHLLTDISIYVCCGKWRKQNHRGDNYRVG